MKNFSLMLVVSFVFSVVTTHYIIGVQIKNICNIGKFTWLPVPSCTATFKDILEKQGLEPVIYSNIKYPLCDQIEKGYCLEEQNTASVTLKGMVRLSPE